jgi:2-keto-4-pentenoate hydratase
MTFTHRLASAVLAAATLAGASSASAECLSNAQVGALVDAFNAKQPAPNPPAMGDADGACSRAKLLALLDHYYRDRVGYKAGLTNPAVQKRFNATSPVWGVLYEKMLLPNGSSIEAAFGARPLYEADLLVRVSDARINQAKTPDDVIQAIDQVIPLMELPDLVVQAPPQLNGGAITAINVGARYGVLGQPIAVPVTRGERFALANAMRDMTVVVKADGAEVDRGKGSDVLEHPLNAVVWLAGDLARHGLALEPGDLVSLGSFSRLLPPKPGMKASVEYLGLPGNPVVSVSFK